MVDAARACGSSPRYVLNPSMPVLLRPDGAVQVGWDPRRAVLVHPPAGLSAAALAALLRSIQSGLTSGELQSGGDADVVDLVGSLLDVGLVTVVTQRRTRSAAIRV